MKNHLLIIPALALCLAACNSSGPVSNANGDILKKNMDSTVNPGDDFFAYANGAWVKATDIPAEESQWGIANLVDDELYKRKRTINEDALKKGESKGINQQIADFWAAGMDSTGQDQQGIKPLQAELDRINAAQTTADVLNVAAHLHSIGVGVFFGEGVSQDEMNSEVMTYHISQGGLGLPNRDYYFDNDARTSGIRAAYAPFITELLSLSGVDSNSAKAKASAIYAIELKLAGASRRLQDLRDPYKNYNKMDMAHLSSTSPGIDWNSVFHGIGLPKIDTVIVGQPEFYSALANVIKTEPVQNLKDYLTFHLINAYAAYLSKPFADARFNFYGKMIRGAKEQRPRWKKVLDAEEGAIGEAVGQLFAKEYFNDKAKKRYSDMVEAIRDAYKERIKNLDWMSDSTKEKALVKLNAITKKVGYPDKWKDFSAMQITRSSWAGNMIAANSWWNTYQINKIGKPVDRTEWDMTPQTYNAYYNPSNNEIVLPAGIFTVPGYRDEELDDALVYGYAAASTIGHEITHGFDDEGRQFDEHGNLHNWWSKEDEEQFKKRSDVLVQQFNMMMPVDTFHINGRQSLGENLADLGGLLLGVDAFKKTEAFKKNELISGLTPMQRFFMGYALGWLYKTRPEELATRLKTDVHAPAKERVNGPLPNVPAFYDAFNVKPGNKMYLPDSLRVRLW